MNLVAISYLNQTCIHYYKNSVLRSTYCIVGSDDHTVRIWECDTGNCIKVLRTHTVADLKFDDNYLITASFDTTAALWNIHTCESVQHYEGHVAAVFSVDFNVDLNLLVTGSADSTVKVWNFREGKMLQNLPQHRSAWITQVKLFYSSDIAAPVCYFILSRDNVSIHLWTINKESHKVELSDEWQNPHNDLVPGLQVRGSKVAFASMDTFNICYMVQSCLTELQRIKQRVSYEVPRDSMVQVSISTNGAEICCCQIFRLTLMTIESNFIDRHS